MGMFQNDIFAYIDGVRSLGWCERECWKSTRDLASECDYLKIKYAPRKIKRPDKIQGPC